MSFTFLFRARAPRTNRISKISPSFQRSAAVFHAESPASGLASVHALPSPGGVRAMTPRQMAGWMHELYLAGEIDRREYEMAIPTEMHPAYNRTVGALTGRAAAPDAPRDMIAEWEERLAFLQRHAGRFGDPEHLRRTKRILELLTRAAS